MSEKITLKLTPHEPDKSLPDTTRQGDIAQIASDLWSSSALTFQTIEEAVDVAKNIYDAAGKV